ncbi:MAG: transglutaminase N-terminal domain-containing protein [Phycisphaeraceae bacterium]
MSVSYKVEHTTRFQYPIPVSVCHNVVCLTPRATPLLTVRHAALTITPRPTVVAERIDGFGNVTHAFSIEEPHDALVVHASAGVTVHPPTTTGQPGPAWEQVAQAVADQSDTGWLEAYPFLYDSALVARTREARELVEQAFTPGRPVLDAALALTRLIHEQFAYKPGSTHVGTTSAQAIAERRGVCQDFAHAQIAALRSIGLPARYVSGYLRTVPPPGQPRLVGVDQSHAWVGVYAGTALGWVEMDPTNAMACGTDHIPLAVGRDYNDVAPIRGAFLGGGESQLAVTVDVEMLGEQPGRAQASPSKKPPATNRAPEA